MDNSSRRMFIQNNNGFHRPQPDKEQHRSKEEMENISRLMKKLRRRLKIDD